MPNSNSGSNSLVQDVVRASKSTGARIPSSMIKTPAALNEAAMVSKLVESNVAMAVDPTSEDGNVGALLSGLEQISKNIMGRIEDHENIAKLFPDIELAIQILVSSVLSPKDMVNCELIYSVQKTRLPASITKSLIEIIKEEINGYYNLQEEQPDILREAAFDHGAHAKIILPESAVDQIINKGVKAAETIDYIGSRRINYGFLSSSQSSSTVRVGESSVHVPYNPKVGAMTEADNQDKDLYTAIGSTLEVYDDYNMFKDHALTSLASQESSTELAPSVLGKMLSSLSPAGGIRAAEAAVSTSSTSPEGDKKDKLPSKGDLRNMLYKRSTSGYTPYFVIPSKDSLKRRSVGRPLYLRWPAESLIPVYRPNDPKDHIGYFGLMAVDGSPISANSAAYDTGQGLSSMLQSDKSTTSLSSMLTEKARRNLGDTSITPTIEQMTDIYTSLVESDFLERKRRGRDTRDVKLGLTNDIMQIMLMRQLRGQMTRAVYIPAEYVCYYALKHHRNGVGKSYLDDLSNITSLRAMVLFSNVMSKVKSAIAVTNVDIAFDARDPDPIKTIEMVKHLVAKTRQQYFPHGLNRVVDLTDWIQRAGVEITWNGHPKLPGTKIEFNTKTVEHPQIDESLEEKFRHQTYMHLGLSPETVDSASKADFATTIQQGSILFARRIKMIGDILTRKNTECVTKIVMNDEVIIERLIEAFSSVKGAAEKVLTDEEKTFFGDRERDLAIYVIQLLLQDLKVGLPAPDFVSKDNLQKEFAAYEKSLDDSLKYIFSPDALPENAGGDVTEHIQSVQNAWKAELMRRWMAANNYMPEAFDIASADEEGRPLVALLDSITEHSKNIELSTLSYLQSTKAARWAANKSLEKLNPPEPGEGGTPTESSGTGDPGSEANPFDNPIVEEEGGENPGGEEVNTPPDETGTGNEKDPFKIE